MSEQYLDDEKRAAEIARDFLGMNRSGNVLNSTRAGEVGQELSKLPVREKFVITSFDKEMALQNYTESELTPSQKATIGQTVSAVASFTGGKIFDRVHLLGIAPPLQEIFPSDEAGNISIINGKVTILINSKHAERRAAPEDVAQYFAGEPPSPLHFSIAHEFGHAMDLIHRSEMKYSAPESQEADIVSCRLFAFSGLSPWEAPTLYGMVSRKEDFAETFAIMALGGDTSRLQSPRKDLMIETVREAVGAAVVGPHAVKLKKLEIK